MALATGKRPKPPPDLFFEAAVAALARMSGRWRRFYRGTWFYRRLLKGQLSDHISFSPVDALPRRLEDADALLHGRFRFGGETVAAMAGGGSIFDVKPPSREWEEALSAFEWLPPLSAAGGDPARVLATNLIAQWLRRNQRYREPAFLPHIVARRLIHLFCHGRFVVVNSDPLWRSRLFVSLREQARLLERTADDAPEGLPRIESAAALALSGLCLEDNSLRLTAGLGMLETELSRQILPDGGAIDRSPYTLAEAFRYLVMVMDTMAEAGEEVPQFLRNAHDRMAPTIRFFRHGDGKLALFNGGIEGDVDMLSWLLAHDDARGKPFAFARHSGYQRLLAGRTLVLFDCGVPPPGPFSCHAHAGSLAFELSAGPQRIVVNCGAAALPCHRKWETVLRATAAHSTATLADTSNATFLPEGWLSRLLGKRLFGGPTDIETSRAESPRGWTVVASHNAYVPVFGIRHERELTLSPQGLALTGIDRFYPVVRRRTPLPFAVRFHIHPDVRLSRAQGGDILLKLPNGEGWRFRAGGPVSVEESVYLGGEQVRKTEQLVLTGSVGEGPAEIAWIFEHIEAA